MFKEISNGSERCCEIRVTIEHKENISELRQGLPQRSSGAEELGSIKGIIELNAKPPPVTKLLPNLFSQITQAKNCPPNTLLPQKLQLMSKERFTRDGHQHFRNLFGYRSEPCCEAAC